jgi:hypothetical protein
MSTMQNFHDQRFSEANGDDQYEKSLKPLASLMPARVKVHPSTLAWDS